ncbi:MAG: type ISP restriction/modification enzyme [Akkermansiaceae bacterium]
MPTDLRAIRNFKHLVTYLEDELEWPLEGHEIKDLTFDYEPDELGLKPAEAAKVKSICQLRPLDSKQPWGIFFIEFDKKKLPVVVLRRILSHLVVKNRASANKADRATWNSEDLLFISAFGAEDDGREISFAHFHQEEGDMPTLRVLGWDGGDTALKLDHLDTTLREKLHWPDGKESLDAWRARWSGVFRHRIGHVINTSDMLAEAMAVLAKRIRDAAQTLIERESDKGPLRKLHQSFKTNLIHDLTEEGFADTYAQTITYGLLTAAISRTEMSEGKHGTALVASNVTDMVPVTNPFLKEMLQTFLHAGGRKGGIDFDELGVQDVVELLRGDETDLPAILRDFGNKTRGEDPVIHFYEHFLSAYNKQLRIQRGVFYTPNPVVSYIVRSVDELIKTEFDLEHGLADTITWGEFIQKSKINNPQSEIKLPPLTDEPGCTETISPDEFFVQILDPATGTATFPVEVIDVIFNYLKDLWKKRGAAAMPSIPNSKSNIQNFPDYWNEYVPKALLPRLHAFELMMAPYAIAHMKVGLKLAETGYKFATEERARIYLTNALEPWQKQLPLIGFDALAHEAAAVNEIKRHKRFTVVIGNPPYSGLSANMSEEAGRIIEPYKYVNGVHFGERKHWLHDDYVKFFRLCETRLIASGVGVLGLITNHAFYDNPSFNGMRWNLLKSFDHLRLLDLHGNTMKREKNPDGSEDKNVFDIQQGVAISLFTKLPAQTQRIVTHGELWGTREQKYAVLSREKVTLSANPLTPSPTFYFFVPRVEDNAVEYESSLRLNEIFGIFAGGFLTARDHFVIDFDRTELLGRIEAFADTSISDAKIRETYFPGCGSDKYPDGDTRGWKVPEARKRIHKDADWKKHVYRCLYRPFDIRWIYWTEGMVDWPRPEGNGHLLNEGNLALVFMRQVASGDGYSHFLVSRLPVDNRACYSNKGIMTFAPLHLHESSARRHGELSFDSTGTRANFTPAFTAALRAKLGNAAAKFTPEDIFHYAYAVLHSPGYRSRYAEFLKIDFPRLPLTGNLELFRALARLGGELTALHLLESPKLDKPITQFIGGSKEVTRIGWSDNTVWLDAPAKKKDVAQAPGSSGFKGVPEAVWNFHIGGYQVCQKWLKDRKGRTLTDEDIAHYHKIVISLSETIRLMAEIDEVTETHGGWPGAFAGDAKS